MSPPGDNRKETPEQSRARFWSHVEKTSGCWLWKAAAFDSGYGVFSLKNRALRAHRHAWELEHGQPAHGLLLHSCNVRRCVRPDHLREGSHEENMADMVAAGNHHNARKTHCPRGHSLLDAYRTRTGTRACRVCYREHASAYRAKKKGVAP